MKLSVKQAVYGPFQQVMQLLCMSLLLMTPLFCHSAQAQKPEQPKLALPYYLRDDEPTTHTADHRDGSAEMLEAV